MHSNNIKCNCYVSFQASFQIHEQEKEATSRALKNQIEDLHERLKCVGETEVNILV